jgi:hypothetical protein
VPYLWGFGLMAAIQPWLTELNPDRWQLIFILGIIGVFYTLLTVGFFYAFLCNGTEQSQIRHKLGLR